MPLKRCLIWLDGWGDRIFLKFLASVDRQISKKLLRAKDILAIKRANWPSVNGGPPDGFTAYLMYTQKKSVSYEKHCSFLTPSLPRYFYSQQGIYLKVPHLNDLVSVMYHWVLGVGCYLSVLSWAIVPVMDFNSPTGGVISTDLLTLYVGWAAGTFLLTIGLMEGTAASKIMKFPYCIFDNNKKSLIICGSGENGSIPYEYISFDLVEIEHSPAYCVIEMNINYPDKPVEKMVTDICASHPQALSILKTYFMMLNGDEALKHLKLKYHPPLLKDFNMPLYKAVAYFDRITWNWFTCIITQYIAFRWAHGHPLGVLKKYIITQELKMPKAIDFL